MLSLLFNYTLTDKDITNFQVIHSDFIFLKVRKANKSYTSLIDTKLITAHESHT